MNDETCAFMTIDLSQKDVPAYPTAADLTLRPLEERDAAAVHRLVNDWEVVRMLSNLPFPYPRGLAESWITGTQRQARAGTAWHFAIERNSILLGCIGLTFEKLRKAARVGYWVGRAHWGQGIATQALQAILGWAFARLNIERVYAEVAEDNHPSISVLERSGFQRVGADLRHLVSRGSSQPVLVYQTTQSCFSENSNHNKMRSSTAETASLKMEDTHIAKCLLLVVAVALIDSDQRILLASRPAGKNLAGLWEFPGGKVEAGETPEAALKRELKEELDVDIDPSCLAPFTFASHDIGSSHLLMPLYLCRDWSGTPRAREGQELAWVHPAEMALYKMPEADAPLIPLLQSLL